MEKGQSLSEILEQIFNGSDKPVTFGETVDKLEHGGMAVILVLFSIPSALPIPAAGYSTVLSVPLLLIGIRILFGHKTVWLPEKMRKKEFTPSSFDKIIKPMKKLVQYFEKISKPRFTKIVNSRATSFFLGLLICALGASMALPIPGTNTLPAGGIFLIGFGLLEDDGLLLFAGIAYSIIALTITTLVIFLGYEIVKVGIKEAMGLL